MTYQKRSTTCGALNAADCDKTVTLNGWIHRNRNHGGVHFIDLRDRYGSTQIVIDPDSHQELKDTADTIKMEYCISVTGIVRLRPQNMINPKMTTGEIEVAVKTLTILNTCPALPFMIDSEDETSETNRLKYRYLDLRSSGMRERLQLRHEATWSVRSYLTEQKFWEIETPTLIKSTPEGARDFLVPSRINPGRFYALPQSPQLYKQILMAGGTDRYYQFARCYRDEDARGDRQPEFTQIDLEMSFVDQDDVLELAEGMMQRVIRDVLNQGLPLPFPRITWKDAMEKYGTDKPDLRLGMEFSDFSTHAQQSDFGVFKSALDSGGIVKALVAKGAAEYYSRTKIGKLEETAKTFGAKGLAWTKVAGDTLDGGVARFFTDQAAQIIHDLNANNGDIIFFGAGSADKWQSALLSLGAVRTQIGKDLNLTKPDDFRFCWVVDFPLFEHNPETGNWDPVHHMFSMPQAQFLDTMEDNPGQVLGNLYDLVLNGNEIASGSVRIHNPELQQRIFDIVGFPQEEAQSRFGFLLEALRYGAPPHAGIAVGFERLVMLMAGVNTIRDVIAFPKNTQGISPMDESPATVDTNQLEELHLAIWENTKEE